jgi:hypothetical protein
MHHVKQGNGAINTEYDKTTQAVFNTLDALGVPDDKVEEALNFMTDMSKAILDPEMPVHNLMSVMDQAAIGIMIHRFFGRHDEHGNRVAEGYDGPNYNDTLMDVFRSIDEQGVKFTQRAVEMIGAVTELKPLIRLDAVPNSDDPDIDSSLVMQYADLVLIGRLVHKFMPVTPNRPTL